MSVLSPKVIQTQVRKKVSRDRHRFQDFEYDLDLSYITQNCVAMGFPSSGVESFWRNNIEDVSKMLKKYHDKHFRIWNLSGRKYNYDKFDNCVVDFGFPDHHNPPFEMLFQIVKSMVTYVEEDPSNVAVIHCVGGKGRTGTVIACFLLYLKIYTINEEALHAFAQRRSSISKGVIQAAQIRYTNYFGDMLYGRVKPNLQQHFTIKRIEMNNPPMWDTSSKPIVEIYSTHRFPKKLLYATPPDQVKAYYGNDGPVIWEMNCPVSSDILVAICEYKGPKKKAKKKLRYSFHCGFLFENVVKLQRRDLDVEDKSISKKWFDANWELKITFGPPSNDAKPLEEQDYTIETDVLDMWKKILESPFVPEAKKGGFNLRESIGSCSPSPRTKRTFTIGTNRLLRTSFTDEFEDQEEEEKNSLPGKLDELDSLLEDALSFVENNSLMELEEMLTRMESQEEV